MSLRSLRRWQWMLIGCSVGLLVGVGRLLARLDEPIGGTGFITQSTFEEELVARPTSLGPIIADIAIHPSRVNGSIDLVTMTRLDDPDDFGQGSSLLAWPWNGGFYMHRTGNNVLFDDLHVALYSRYDPATMTFNPHKMEAWEDVTPN